MSKALGSGTCVLLTEPGSMFTATSDPGQTVPGGSLLPWKPAKTLCVAPPALRYLGQGALLVSSPSLPTASPTASHLAPQGSSSCGLNWQFVRLGLPLLVALEPVNIGFPSLFPCPSSSPIKAKRNKPGGLRIEFLLILKTIYTGNATNFLVVRITSFPIN